MLRRGITKKIKSKLNTKKTSMTMWTAHLWLQYQDMIDILKTFTCIKDKQTGNWNLHLQAVLDMLPYLAASDHQLYTKSAYVYLQTMTDLS